MQLLRKPSVSFISRIGIIISFAVILVLVVLAIQDCPAAASPSAPRRSNKRGTNGSLDMLVHEREFISPQLRVQMDCQRDKTIMKLNFTKPFNGIIGAGRLETTKCKLIGTGAKYYELQVLHNATDCDTQWDSANSSILNNLFVRFHSSLETGSDIAKNIVCRLTVGDLVVGRRPTARSSSSSSSNSGNSPNKLELAPASYHQLTNPGLMNRT